MGRRAGRSVRRGLRSGGSRRRSWLADRPGIKALLWAGGTVVVVFVVAGVLAGLKVRRAGSQLVEARALLRHVDHEITNGQLAQARAHLRQAQSVLGKANNSLYGGPEFGVVDWLPVVSQNIDSLRSSIGLAYTMVNGGVEVLDDARPLEDAHGKLEISLKHGGIPLDTVVSVQHATAQLAAQLPESSERPGSHLLVGKVADLQRDIYDEAGKRRKQLGVLSRAMALLDEMAGANGERHYLIAVANTAEERGAGGMILSYGQLDASGGTFTLGPFGNVSTLPKLTAPVKTTLPADYRKRWDGFAYDSNFRQATLGADFPTVAPSLVDLYKAATGTSVDGVIQIDPEGLAAILEGTGPVDVPGLGRVDADDVVDFAVNQAYFQYPDRDERSSVLGDVARACFDRLLSGDYPSLRGLATSLSQAVGGRHLLMWSDKPAAADQLRFFDADGSLPAADADYLSLTVQNLSGNKLDYYLRTALDVRSAADRDDDSRRFVDVSVQLTNTAPVDGDLRYVFGPFDATQVRGRYHGIVSLYVPIGTSLLGATGPAATTPAVYTEAGREVVSFEVNTEASSTDTFVLHLAMVPVPDGQASLLVVPQPRVHPTAVRVALRNGSGPPLRAKVDLTRSWYLVPGRPPQEASGPALAEARAG